MKYHSCKYIESGINFHFEHIKPCCSIFYGPIFVSQYKGEKINWKTIQEKRNLIREEFKKGNINESCKKCYCLQYDDWNDNPQINCIHIYHWLHCNCGCTYCSNIKFTKGEYSPKAKKSDYYDLLPILKEMSKEKMIAENSDINFVGGEPTVLKEFDGILKLLLKHNPQNVSILTSAIKYSKSVEKCIKANKGNLVISLDSGCAETYFKIKRVEEFGNVVKNIKKYLSSCKSAIERIQLKYIILEKLNDNIEEIEKFLQLAKGINLKRVRFDVEFCHSMHSGKKIPEHLYSLFEYAQKRCIDLNLKLETFDLVDTILEKGHY